VGVLVNFTRGRISKSKKLNAKMVHVLKPASSKDVSCTVGQLIHMLDGTCRSVKVLRKCWLVLLYFIPDIILL
jgi:hypothetical protein